MAVVFDQTGAGKACGNLLNHLFHLIVLQPRINDLQLLAQHRQHHHLGECFAKGIAGILFIVQVDDLPTQAVKLIKQRLFNVVALVEFDVLRCILSHTSHPSLGSLETCSRTMVGRTVSRSPKFRR